MSDHCAACKGTKRIPKKVWTQGPPVEGVHPAILAARPAYRTVVEFPCTECPAKVPS